MGQHRHRHSQQSASEHPRADFQIIAIIVFLPLAYLAVILRIWVRRWMIRCFGSDDVMMALALLGFTIYCTALLVQMFVYHNGQTQHYKTLEGAVDWTIVGEVFYLITMIFLKLSLGLFFLRIIPKRGLRRLIYFTMALSTVVNTYHVFFVVFTCGDPVHYLHNTFRGKCVDNKVVIGLAYEQTVITTLTDWVFAILPVTILWKAKMDLRTKIVAGIILSLGALGSVASIVRFIYIPGLAIKSDFFWSAAKISLWSTIELGTGIVAGSMATLRPLFKKLFYKAKTITMTMRNFHTSPSGRPARTEPRPSMKYVTSRGRTRQSSGPRFAGRGKGSQGSADSSSSRNTVMKQWDQNRVSCYRTTILGTHEAGEIFAGGDQVYEIYDEERGLGVGGVNLREEKRVHLLHVRDSASYHEDDNMWSSEQPGSIQWPFSSDSPETGISKVVDVEVSTSRVDPLDNLEDGMLVSYTPAGTPPIGVGRFSSIRIPERVAMTDSLHSKRGSILRSGSFSSNRKPSPNRGMSWFKSTPSTAAHTPPPISTPSFSPSKPVVITTTSDAITPIPAPPKRGWSPTKTMNSYFTAKSSPSPRKLRFPGHSTQNSRDDFVDAVDRTVRSDSRGTDRIEEWDKLPDLILVKSANSEGERSPGLGSPWGMFKTKSRTGTG